MDAALPWPPVSLAFVACESLGRFAVNGRRGQDPHSTEQRDYQFVLTPSEHNAPLLVKQGLRATGPADELSTNPASDCATIRRRL